MDETQNSQSKLGRACWTMTTVVCVAVGIVMFIKGDRGYGVVCLVVALCAMINLF